MKGTTWSRVMAILAIACLTLSACGRDDGGDGAGAPGVTKDTIKLGTSFPLSGPASAYSTIARSSKAYFDYINSRGGVHGRKIEYVVLDDGYSPPRALNNARRLIQRENVFAIFNMLGTPTNLAVWDYVNEQEVPHVFLATGASEWGADPDEHPWTIGWQPDYLTEGNAMGNYLKDEMPDARVAILFQNDDFGEGVVRGLERAIEGSDVEIVARESYEVTDPTVSLQVRKLARSDADVFVDVATPKPAAQAIDTLSKSSWDPLHMMSNVSASKTLVFRPAGLKASRGILATNYLKDTASPRWRDDPAVREYKKNLKRFNSRLNPDEPFNAYGWAAAHTMVTALEQAGKDLTREKLMDVVRSMDTEVPLLLPGIRITTGPDDGYPIESVQMQRFNGRTWDEVGPVYHADRTEA